MPRIELNRYIAMESGKDDLHSKLFEVRAQMCDISRQISANEASYQKQICDGQVSARQRLKESDMIKQDIHDYKEKLKDIYKHMMIDLGLLDLDVNIWSNGEDIHVEFDIKV